jgi:hypothetical protein
MSRARAGRLGLAVLLGAAVLTDAGCALDMPKQAAEKEAEAVPRPEWRVGDRWVFQRTALTGATAVVTHQVVAATVEGYTVRVLGLAAEVSRQWTPDLHLVQEGLGAGTTARYEPPASYFTWPIAPGKTWAQEFQYTDGRNDGRYANTWKVGDKVDAIDTVAGRFYSLRVERWSGTQRLEAYWYNPRVRYWVRLEDYLRGYVEELVEFRSWGGS